MEPKGVRTEAELEVRRSLTEPKGWRNKVQPKAVEVRGGGRAMTDQVGAGGMMVLGGAEGERSQDGADRLTV